MQQMPQEYNQPMQNEVPPENEPEPKKSNTMRAVILSAAVILIGIIICVVIFAMMNNTTPSGNQDNSASAPQTDTSQNNTPTAQTPVTSEAPEITITPYEETPNISTPSNLPATPSQPAMSAADMVASDTVINRQAYQLVLTIKDMGNEWRFATAASPTKKMVSSSSHIIFTNGTAYTPVIHDIVYVFRTVSAAKDIYEEERMLNGTGNDVTNPSIGDECFLNEIDSNHKLLVFRENNVVVWIHVQQWADGDPVKYALMQAHKLAQ